MHVVTQCFCFLLTRNKGKAPQILVFFKLYIISIHPIHSVALAAVITNLVWPDSEAVITSSILVLSLTPFSFNGALEMMNCVFIC